MINCESVLVSVIICTWSIHEGCHVNDWPNSCQANFMIGSQGCEPCATGSYGCNCSVWCLDNTYGHGCYHVCNCSADEYCDPVEGCTINGSTINQTKACKSGRYGCNCSGSCPDNTYGSGCYHVCNCSDEEFCDHVNGCTKNSTTVSKKPTDKLPVESSSVSPYQEGVYVTASRQGGKHLMNLTMSLVVSSLIVIVFCTMFVCILTRVSKCYYKCKYSKMLNQLQSSASRAEDTHIYSDYEFTEYRDTSSSDPLNTEINIYDQSSRASYDILVLRNQSSTVNIYGSDCNSDIIPPRSKPDYKSSPINHAKKDLDFELEPECLLNLFKEEEKDVSPCHLSNLNNVQYEFISETKL